MKKIVIILFITLFVSGCWNYKELNEISITTGLAIDYEDNKYKLTALVSNAKKQEGSSKEGDSQIVVYESSGKTISEALKNIDLKLPKELYLKHVGVIIIGEEVAKNGVKNILDYLIRDPESPNRLFLLLAKDAKAGDILKIISPLEAFPSESISLLLETAMHLQGTAIEISYNDFIQAYLEKGKNPILSTITVKGSVEEGKKNENTEQSEPETYVQLEEIAIFNEDKYIGTVNQKQSLGINIINNKVQNIKLQIPCEDDYIVVNLNKIKTSTKIDEDLKSEINVNGNGYITEANCKIDLSNNKSIEKINKDVEKEITKIIKNTIEKLQEYKSDVFGFGNKYYKQFSKKWKKMESKWDEEIFKTIKFNINSNVELKSKGTSNKTISEVFKDNE